MPKDLVLIPTSRFVDAEMQLEVGRVPPALIPINGKPLYCAIADKFSEAIPEAQLVLVANEGKDLIYDEIDHQSHLEAQKKPQVVEVPSGLDLGQVIRHALEALPLDAYDRLFINFGDTLVDTDLSKIQDAIYFEDLHESYRWTSFNSENGKIVRITDKHVQEQIESTHVFTGLFQITAPRAFLDSLRKPSLTSDIGTFYSALKYYLDQRRYDLVKVVQWYDFGHGDNYQQSKKKFINKRYFNELDIDSTHAVVTKRSSNTTKFISEIKWYLDIPTALKPYTPQIYDHSINGSDSFVKMEYYGYPTVGDLYRFGGYNLGIWNHVFDGIFRMVREMRQFRLQIPHSELRATCMEMYATKTSERVSEIAHHPVLGPLLNRELKINGTTYPSVSNLLERLPIAIDRALAPQLTELTIIHGDLCISNILFDPRSRVIKLIDPRGSFGKFEMYGDWRYEIAKLSHSFNGNYEIIIADRFFAICQDDSIDYSLRTGEYQNKIATLFNTLVNANWGSERTSIDLIESLLFLSMIPLHGDFLNRQIVMLAQAIEKLSAAYKAIGIRA